MVHGTFLGYFKKVLSWFVNSLQPHSTAVMGHRFGVIAPHTFECFTGAVKFGVASVLLTIVLIHQPHDFRFFFFNFLLPILEGKTQKICLDDADLNSITWLNFHLTKLSSELISLNFRNNIYSEQSKTKKFQENDFLRRLVI